MQHLNMHTPNLADENFARLAALFPNAVTETTDAGGKVIRAIDKDVLMQEINCYVVDGKEERYQFTWPDKKKSVILANAPSTNTLRPCVKESVGRGGEAGGFDSENLYIEGDNLEVLKLLKETYLHKIKMIYIDPPYNTGNDFVYDDSFDMESERFKIENGELRIENDGSVVRMVKNFDSNGRFHTDWLNMIYPRLRLAKDLLTDDGVIFISIDDNEVENLKKVCDEIFGESNFITEFPRVTKKGGKSSDYIAKNHDFVVAYSKSQNVVLYPPEHDDEGYNQKDEFFEERGFYKLNQTLDYDSLGYVSSLDYPIEIEGETFYAGGSKDDYEKRQQGNHGRADWGWRWSKELYNFGFVNGFIVLKRTNNGSRIYTKTYQNVTIEKVGNKYEIVKIKRTKPLSTLEYSENVYSNDNAKKAIEKLLGNGIFEYTKPVSLLKSLIQLATGNSQFSTLNSPLILDFFSGSATTAHAVMQLNAEDGGNRKFIMVQLPEKCDESSEAFKAGYKNICEIGKERIRRAGKKVISDKWLEISKEEKAKYGCKELPRIDCMAKINGSSQNDLFSSEEVAERGDVRSVGSDAKGGSINSIEHSGGTSPKLNEGIHTVSLNSNGVESGVGNTTVSNSKDRIPCTYGHFGNNGIASGSGENVECPYKFTKKCPLTTIHSSLTTDIGFRVLKLDTSNMQEVYYTPQATDQQMLSGMVDNIKPDRTDMDLLFQIMLEYGISLSSKIECKKIDGKDVYFVEDTFLAACFDKAVNDVVVTEIAKAKPQYVALRDMDSDATLTNFEQIFNAISPETVCKVV